VVIVVENMPEASMTGALVVCWAAWRVAVLVAVLMVAEMTEAVIV